MSNRREIVSIMTIPCKVLKCALVLGFLVLSPFLFGCRGKATPPNVNPALVEMREEILDGMRSYMKDGETPYTEEHVLKCGQVLDAHLVALSSARNDAEAKALVKDTVTRLNELNNDCDGELIETGQREGICTLLTKAGAQHGFNGPDEDVPEEWREW